MPITQNEKHSMLDQMYSRLCFHCGAASERHTHKRARFVASLISYPDDLLCAAYQHISHHLLPSRVPTEAEFIEFMTPEFERRQSIPALVAGSGHVNHRVCEENI